MLIVLRILFGAALLFEMIEGARNAGGTGEAGDLTGAYYLVICVGLGFLNALVWAPYLGDKVSGPLTGTMTESTYVERTNWISKMLKWTDARGFRRWTAALCFWEAVRHPSSPTPFIVGLKNAPRDSWLEKIYAREVFQFNNTQNSLQAYVILKRHGVDPRPHRNQEVNIMLLSLEKPPRPEAVPIAIPAAPRLVGLKRNPQIRLFRRSDDPLDKALVDSPPAGSVTPAVPSVEPEIVSSSRGGSRPHGQPFATGISIVWARVVAFLKAE